MVGKMNIKLIFIADVMSFYRILNFLFFDTHERMNMYICPVQFIVY